MGYLYNLPSSSCRPTISRGGELVMLQRDLDDFGVDQAEEVPTSSEDEGGQERRYKD